MRQNRPWLPTAILAGVAVLLAAFAIWVIPQLGQPPQGDSNQPTPQILFGFAPSDLVRISVTQGFLMTSVERVGLEWRVVSPTAGEADSVRLNDLSVRIAGMRSTRALEGVDPANFGLVDTAAQVSLALTNGTSVNFSIGDENPGGTGRYVLRAGDSRVHIVPSEYVNGILELASNPPYPPTPAPPPSPLETPASETDESLTPEAEETPTAEAEETPTTTPTTTPTPEPEESPTPTP